MSVVTLSQGWTGPSLTAAATRYEESRLTNNPENAKRFMPSAREARPLAARAPAPPTATVIGFSPSQRWNSTGPQYTTPAVFAPSFGRARTNK